MTEEKKRASSKQRALRWGTARCRQGHGWNARARYESGPEPSGLLVTRRIVLPDACPHCLERWHTFEELPDG